MQKVVQFYHTLHYSHNPPSQASGSWIRTLLWQTLYEKKKIQQMSHGTMFFIFNIKILSPWAEKSFDDKRTFLKKKKTQKETTVPCTIATGYSILNIWIVTCWKFVLSHQLDATFIMTRLFHCGFHWKFETSPNKVESNLGIARVQTYPPRNFETSCNHLLSFRLVSLEWVCVVFMTPDTHDPGHTSCASL